MNAIAPIDQKFFELIIPIATFLTGTLSGIMLAGNDKDAKMKALEAANKGGAPSPSTPAPSLGGGGFSASANIGGTNFSFNKSPAPVAQSAFKSPAPSTGFTPVAAAPAAPKMSSTGKPMPQLEEDEEL